jgi:hypothetical protein
MAITLRERYTQTTQDFVGLQQARDALKTWLQINDIDVYNHIDSNPTGWALLWEVGGHSPILDVDYQYRVELPGPVNLGVPSPQ